MKISVLKKEFVASSLNNLKEARLALKKVRALASAAAKIDLAMRRSVSESDGAYVNSYAGSSGRIYVNVNLKVDSFKDDRGLLSALEMAIEKMGGSAKYETKDYPDYNSREYRFDAGGICLVVNAVLKGEGNENCRRVEVSSKMVEVKEYKFVCDGVPS